MGNYGEAYHWISEGLVLGKKMGDPNLISFSISSLAETDYALGLLDEMEINLREGIQVATENGSRFTHSMLQEQLAQILNTSGKFVEAEQLCQASIALYKELGDDWSLSRAVNLLGMVKLAMGDCTEAQNHFAYALEIAFNAKSYTNVIDALTGIAEAQAKNRNDFLALELTYHILQSPFSTHQAQGASNRLLTELEARLTPPQIELAKALARTQSLDQIVNKIAGSALS
jgi:tetratricopeptide (TPR) repeat protein